MDLNADLGEFNNDNELDLELKLLGVITSCSIACGGHAGDRSSILKIISAASTLGVAVGPHPSYPDTEGFGRRSIEISIVDLKDALSSQITEFINIAKKQKVAVRHIQLHGQLYNDVAQSTELSEAFISVIKENDLFFNVVGPYGSATAKVCQKHGLPFVSEAFVDRRYRSNLSLVKRSDPSALINSIEERVSQARQIAINQSILIHGKKIRLQAQTLCIHGDTPQALKSAQTIKDTLETEGVNFKYYG